MRAGSTTEDDPGVADAERAVGEVGQGGPERGRGDDRRPVQERVEPLGQICAVDHRRRAAEDRRADQVAEIQRHRDASPPVSPSVVAGILMIQKISVTSGTLVKISARPDCARRVSSRLLLAGEVPQEVGKIRAIDVDVPVSGRRDVAGTDLAASSRMEVLAVSIDNNTWRWRIVDATGKDCCGVRPDISRHRDRAGVR